MRNWFTFTLGLLVVALALLGLPAAWKTTPQVILGLLIAIGSLARHA